jgi:hypothetical protein
MPTDGRALVKAGRSLKPYGVVVEVSSSHLDGLDAAELLKHKLPSLKAVIARKTIDHLLRTPKRATPDQRITRREPKPAGAVRDSNQAAKLENALQTFAFPKYNTMEESRDHPQGRTASVRRETRYGANA